MAVQLGKRCPKLLKVVNNQPHATDQDHEPTVEKEMMEAEGIQSPRSSISDENFSSNKGEMPPPKFHGCAADTTTSPLKFGSGPRDSRVPYDTWDTWSQRKRKRNRKTYGAIKNDAPLRTAERKTNIHGSDHRQGNRRKKSPSLYTQGAFKMLKPILTLPETSALSEDFHMVSEHSSQELSKPVIGFQAPPEFAFNDFDDGSTGTPSTSKDFQLPSSAETLGCSSASTPISSPLLSPIEISKDIPDTDFERPLEAQCPICDASVQQEDLDNFKLQHPGMEFRLQQLFCHAHKKRESEDEWRRHGYPDIDWKELPYRLGKYRWVIDEILMKPIVSYFRSEMTKRLRRGKDRNLMMHVQHEGLQNCSVGYYGPRGMKVMTDFILAEFSDDIRKLAGSDKIIAARGATGYVQMVLAPELATRLIMDDMRQSHPNMKEKEAREILGSSSNLGYLLNGLEDVEQQAITSESQQVVIEGNLEDV